MTPTATPQTLGRYALYDRIASGGMATVYFAQLLGTGGFSKIVAVKRLHPHLALEKEFAAMLLDEAYLAGRIQHPNVVSTLDVVSEKDELFVVMEYVHGETLAKLSRAAAADGERIPVGVAVAIMVGVLNGLHAAHETKSERGEPLAIVHRDVSPQNVVVGVDGVPRILDFGVAKARNRLHTTQDGTIKGKLRYMAVEQLTSQGVDRRADIYGAGVMLWELLTGRRLFDGETESATMHAILQSTPAPPSSVVPGLDPALDAITLRAVAREPTGRFETARHMAAALEQAVPVASATEVGEWVACAAEAHLADCARIVRAIDAQRGGRAEESGTRASTAATPGAAVAADADIPVAHATTDDAGTLVAPPDANVAPRRRAGANGWVYGLAGAALATMASVGFAAYSNTTRSRTPPASPDAPAQTAQTAQRATAERSASFPAAPSATSPVPGDVTGAASASVAVAPAVTPLVPPAVAPAAGPRKPQAAPRRPRAGGHASADPECNPPYTIDQAGVRHYKVACPLE